MSKRLVYITIIIVLAVALIGGTTLLSQKNPSPVVPTPTVTPTLSPLPQPAKESNVEKPQTGLANPASVYCEEQGGDSKIITATDGAQSGQCIFPDGKTCEEWDFFRTKVCK